MSGVAPRAAASAAAARSTSDGHRNAALDRRLAAKRHDERRERHQSRAGHSWAAGQSRSEMRAVVVEVPAEERGHEERDERDGPLKARQFGFDAQVRLICRVAVHREVGALHLHQRAHLRRDRLVPVQSFSEHHRLARKENRRACGIDGLVDATHAVAGRVEGKRRSSVRRRSCAPRGSGRTSSRVAESGRRNGSTDGSSHSVDGCRQLRASWPAPIARTAAIAPPITADGRSTASRPMRGRATSSRNTPTSASATRDDDSRNTYQRRIR